MWRRSFHGNRCNLRTLEMCSSTNWRIQLSWWRSSRTSIRSTLSSLVSVHCWPNRKMIRRRANPSSSTRPLRSQKWPWVSFRIWSTSSVGECSDVWEKSPVDGWAMAPMRRWPSWWSDSRTNPSMWRSRVYIPFRCRGMWPSITGWQGMCGMECSSFCPTKTLNGKTWPKNGLMCRCSLLLQKSKESSKLTRLFRRTPGPNIFMRLMMKVGRVCLKV